MQASTNEEEERGQCAVMNRGRCTLTPPSGALHPDCDSEDIPRPLTMV